MNSTLLCKGTTIHKVGATTDHESCLEGELGSLTGSVFLCVPIRERLRWKLSHVVSEGELMSNTLHATWMLQA